MISDIASQGDISPHSMHQDVFQVVSVTLAGTVAVVFTIVICLCCSKNNPGDGRRMSSYSSQRDTVQLEDLLTKPSLADPESVFSEPSLNEHYRSTPNRSPTGDSDIATSFGSPPNSHTGSDDCRREPTRARVQKPSSVAEEDINYCTGDDNELFLTDKNFASNKDTNIALVPKEEYGTDPRINEAAEVLCEQKEKLSQEDFANNVQPVSNTNLDEPSSQDLSMSNISKEILIKHSNIEVKRSLEKRPNSDNGHTQMKSTSEKSEIFVPVIIRQTEPDSTGNKPPEPDSVEQNIGNEVSQDKVDNTQRPIAIAKARKTASAGTSKTKVAVKPANFNFFIADPGTSRLRKVRDSTGKHQQGGTLNFDQFLARGRCSFSHESCHTAASVNNSSANPFRVKPLFEGNSKGTPLAVNPGTNDSSSIVRSAESRSRKETSEETKHEPKVYKRNAAINPDSLPIHIAATVDGSSSNRSPRSIQANITETRVEASDHRIDVAETVAMRRSFSDDGTNPRSYGSRIKTLSLNLQIDFHFENEVCSTDPTVLTNQQGPKRKKKLNCPAAENEKTNWHRQQGLQNCAPSLDIQKCSAMSSKNTNVLNRVDENNKTDILEKSFADKTKESVRVCRKRRSEPAIFSTFSPELVDIALSNRRPSAQSARLLVRQTALCKRRSTLRANSSLRERRQCLSDGCRHKIDGKELTSSEMTTLSKKRKLDIKEINNDTAKQKTNEEGASSTVSGMPKAASTGNLLEASQETQQLIAQGNDSVKDNLSGSADLSSATSKPPKKPLRKHLKSSEDLSKSQSEPSMLSLPRRKKNDLDFTGGSMTLVTCGKSEIQTKSRHLADKIATARDEQDCADASQVQTRPTPKPRRAIKTTETVDIVGATFTNIPAKDVERSDSSATGSSLLQSENGSTTSGTKDNPREGNGPPLKSSLSTKRNLKGPDSPNLQSNASNIELRDTIQSKSLSGTIKDHNIKQHLTPLTIASVAIDDNGADASPSQSLTSTTTCEVPTIDVSDESDYDHPWDSLDNAVQRASMRYNRRPSRIAAGADTKTLLLKSAEDLGRLLEQAEKRRQLRQAAALSTVQDRVTSPEEDPEEKPMIIPFTRFSPYRHTVKGIVSQSSRTSDAQRSSGSTSSKSNTKGLSYSLLPGQDADDEDDDYVEIRPKRGGESSRAAHRRPKSLSAKEANIVKTMSPEARKRMK